MSTLAQLKEVHREYVQVVWEQKNLAALGQYLTPDFVDHSAPPGLPQGLDGTRQLFAMIQAAFPDFHATIELEIAEGDFCVARLAETGTHRGMFFGIPPTGRRISMSRTRIWRFRDGKMTEHWSNSDDLGLMQQLGAIQLLGS